MHSQDISHNLLTTGLFPWSKVVLCPWLPSLTPAQPPNADRSHSKKTASPSSWWLLISPDFGKPTLKEEDAPAVVAEMVFWRRHLDLFASHLEVWKKTPLWKVSYEECSLFETSTTQTPTLSRIESLAVHINTFQAQIKKCKQNKKIYIYIIFSPIQRFQVSMQQILLNTDSLRSTLFKQLGQTGPCKGYCLFNTWGGDHGRHGTGEVRKGEEKEWAGKGERVCAGEDGAAGTQTWWVGRFHLLVFDIFFLVCFNFPLPRSTKDRKTSQQRVGPY